MADDDGGDIDVDDAGCDVREDVLFMLMALKRRQGDHDDEDADPG